MILLTGCLDVVIEIVLVIPLCDLKVIFALPAMFTLNVSFKEL